MSDRVANLDTPSASALPTSDKAELLTVALVGAPNCGKSTLFNQLTGAKQKIANYAGVTVERKQGAIKSATGRRVDILDLPGCYSLTAIGPDEVITRDICHNRLKAAEVDLLVCVVDATNLRLHLHLVLEVLELNRPTIVVINQIDVAERRGIVVNQDELSKALGVPVLATVALKRRGVALLHNFLEQLPLPVAPFHLAQTRKHDKHDLHLQIRQIMQNCVTIPRMISKTDERLDRILLHPVFGLMILTAVMFLSFQAVFYGAIPFMTGIIDSFAAISGLVQQLMPQGLLNDFLTQAVIGGLGTVVGFLPQIVILFAFILVLEESGYLPRAAFLLDRLMMGAGLSGRAFIPLLSSFACAIPGIMATRTIPDRRDRLLTILISPLMTCSARLPVYTLIISAFIPNKQVFGVINLPGLVLFILYIVGILSGLLVAKVVNTFKLHAVERPLMMEIPNYRLPSLHNLGLGLWERAMIFVRRVTGVIFAVNSLLWILTQFPRSNGWSGEAEIQSSIAGIVGRFIEPIFAPIGFNWQITIALIPGLAAREVAVSSLATVYASSGALAMTTSASSKGEVIQQLGEVITNSWTMATGLSLVAWYVFAPQCLSTLAVIRRETNSMKFVWITTGYLFGLAYVAALATYQIAKWWH